MFEAFRITPDLGVENKTQQGTYHSELFGTDFDWNYFDFPRNDIYFAKSRSVSRGSTIDSARQSIVDS